MTSAVAPTGEQIAEGSRDVQRLMDEARRVVVGQEAMLRGLLIGLLCDGHVLLEGAPGLAKSLAVHTLAQAVDGKFRRIQFTPDLLPADLIGTLVYNPRESEFTTRLGPIFANFVLADEINRAPAKVQSALLEAMQERQVTIGEASHPLPDPFLVLATQNPIEQEGAYPLPEAQVDRFMLKVVVEYPSAEEERAILDRMSAADGVPEVKAAMSLDQLGSLRSLVRSVFVDGAVREYIVNLVLSTRPEGAAGLGIERFIEYGASPRATLALTRAAKANAFLRGREYVTPDDVRATALEVLRHRLIITYEAEAEERDADGLVREILERVPGP